MRTIIVANQKGGVGKTTTVLALEQMYKQDGYKVLVIDLDGQCNTTHQHEEIPSIENPNTSIIENQTTIYDVLVLPKRRADIHEAIQHTKTGDIVAGDPLLADADSSLEHIPNWAMILKEQIDSLKDEYDFVIIDTSPFLNKTLMCGLISANEVLIPVSPKTFSIEGLVDLYKSIENAKQFNPELKICGLVRTMATSRDTNSAKNATKAMNQLADLLGTKVFETKIRNCSKVDEGQSIHTNILNYDAKCNTSLDYLKFYEELNA